MNLTQKVAFFFGVKILKDELQRKMEGGSEKQAMGLVLWNN